MIANKSLVIFRTKHQYARCALLIHSTIQSFFSFILIEYARITHEYVNMEDAEISVLHESANLDDRSHVSNRSSYEMSRQTHV